MNGGLSLYATRGRVTGVASASGVCAHPLDSHVGRWKQTRHPDKIVRRAKKWRKLRSVYAEPARQEDSADSSAPGW